MMTEETKGTNAGASVPKKVDGAVGFMVLAFTNELAAEAALKDMEKARKQDRFYFENAAVIRQDANGNVHYRETGDMPKGGGAGIGALIGGTLGILGGPVGVALGAGAGAALGAAIAKTDDGFKDANLKKVGIALRPGSSAVAAITDNAFLKDFHQQVPETEIRKFVNGLAKEISTTAGRREKRCPGHSADRPGTGNQGAGRRRKFIAGGQPAGHEQVPAGRNFSRGHRRSHS